MNKLGKTPTSNPPPHTHAGVEKTPVIRTHVVEGLESTNKQNVSNLVHMYTHTRIHIHVYAYIYTDTYVRIYIHVHMHLYTHRCTHIHPRRCKTSSVGQSAGLSVPRSSVRFRHKLKKPRTRIYIDSRYIDPHERVLNYCFE